MKLNEVIKNIDVWSTWVDSYKKYVPQFIEEAKTKTNWQDWDKDVFREYFERSNDQCVSSLKQGYYTNIEKESIKKNWSELAILLKKIADQQDQVDLVTYDEVKKWFRKHTSQNRKAAANRLIASLQPNLLCTIVNEDSLRALMQRINNLDATAELKISWNWFENSNSILNYFKEKVPHDNVYDIMTYPWQTFEILSQKETAINSNEMSEIEDNTSKIKSLLEYKKQIILQGPPGTGKTKLAKEIAEIVIKPTTLKSKPKTINNADIKRLLLIGQEINSVKNRSKYTINEVTENNVRLGLNTGSENSPSFSEIINWYADKRWDKKGEQENGLDSYGAAVAKYIYENIEESDIVFDLKNCDQFKLIQFHPSYTYEDFVRGIVAKPNPDGDGIIYEAENKTLGAFAKKALENFVDSNKDVEAISKEAKIKELFENFVEYLNDEIENANGFYALTENVGLISSDDEHAFRYKGLKDGWLKNGNRILFKDILQSYFEGDSVRKDIKNNPKISGLARQHASYFVRVLNLFQKFIKNKNLEKDTTVPVKKVDLKNYVLIIDEINRANLSSVLGELIYALEYREEAVESMYNVDGHQLILPPNLYIIGTMNTADRSVGHIDYAIRRRFAFVDVPAENLKETKGLDNFDDVLFKKVSTLFDTNLSPEFEKKDVQLGHSYFIDKTDEGGSMSIRFEYEIKPILLEYVKDGVLIGTDIIQKIEDLMPSI
ncbi:AAA family ATPase [Flavobacterium suncheonense]|uniref:AAA family ATPase n=1 Tax=Flavobacterium suncheonense TaxID=350894 RepID=UPI00041B5817|nr:AAA family ATPase [Flavobacterium suncheonense]